MTQTAFTQGDTAGPALAPTQRERRDFAQQLRQMTVASRVRHEKFGVKKALSASQIKEAAATFDADGKSLSMAKKLVDTSDPAFRAVVHARSQASSYWRQNTTPYPEPGTRLIRKSFIDPFNEQMKQFRDELAKAVAQLQDKYSELRERASHDLGTLFNPHDYPPRIDTEFGLEWDFPSIEPPDYLRDLHPQLYEQECERVKGRFEEAVRLTEQALATKFAEMVNHLAERLAPEADGQPRKIIRNSSIDNLKAFIADFRSLDMGTTGMTALVEQAEKVLAGVDVKDLRTADEKRQQVAEQIGEISKAIEGMMIEAPKRAISLED